MVAFTKSYVITSYSIHYTKLYDKDVTEDDPLFLTKNGRGRYVIIDIVDYEKQQAKMKLLAKLAEAENAVKNSNEWLTGEEVRKNLGV